MASPFRSLSLAALALVATAAAQGNPDKPRPAQPARPAVKLTPPAPRQEKPQSELIALREKKLAKEVFQNAEWFLDYDKARAAAKEQGKLLLVYFTRSYAY